MTRVKGDGPFIKLGAPPKTKRSGKVMQQFKAAKAKGRDDCCEVCRWRPPKALREVAGRMIGRLLHGHHIIPVACGGPDTEENLILLCPTHHAIAHHMGRMVPDGLAPCKIWWGPRTKRELLATMHMLTMPEQYAQLAEMEHNFADYIEWAHDQALAMADDEHIRVNRLFTVSRGNPVKRTA